MVLFVPVCNSLLHPFIIAPRCRTGSLVGFTQSTPGRIRELLTLFLGTLGMRGGV